MKYYKQVLSLLALLVFFSTAVLAQEEITTDEWEAEIARLSTEKADLTKELESLQADVNKLVKKKNSLQKIDECNNEMYALVGADADQVADYSSKVNALMADISAKKAEKADRQAELDKLKTSKLSALPAFYSLVHGKLQKMLDAWVEAPKDIQYEVVRGDHLWGIAKKKDHYGNGHAWPMIYNANRDQIKNPDLIYPKQVLTVPHLSDEETAKYNKIKENYKPAPME